VTTSDTRKVTDPTLQARDKRPDTIADVEISLLLEGVFLLFGYDFRQYLPNSLKRRIADLMRAEKLHSVSAVQDRIFHDPNALNRFVSSLSVQASEFFRDPEFFLSFRKKAVPLLRTYPLIRMWHAGCASGEEVYSMAILLNEEGLLSKSLLYATDINTQALQVARYGTYSATHLEKYQQNYMNAGGSHTLRHYFVIEGRNAQVNQSLRDHIVFTEHNLATDASFNEFNVILCRNVLIYFTPPLRNRVHSLLHASLTRFGLLVLGSKETIFFTEFQKQYSALDEANKIYRRVD